METQQSFIGKHNITCTILLLASLTLQASEYTGIRAREVELDHLSSNPIIMGTTQGSHVSKEYSWGGTGISTFYGWQSKKIAEIWFFSTQKDGLTHIPEHQISLKDLIDCRTVNMLGTKSATKPIFCKILGKDEHAPQILHSGFCKSIVGQEAYFVDLCKQERNLVVQLKNMLTHYISSQEQFMQFKKSFDQWTSTAISQRWTNQESLPQLPSFMSNFDCSIFDRLLQIRQKLVSFLNEIPLQQGQVILSPVGNIHSIVGSHQIHPPAEHPDAKNEAYYIFSIESHSSDCPKQLLYFEPQQTSNTTYSPFDFASPIEYKNNTVTMRKDLRQGLDALISSPQEIPASEEQAIELMLKKAVAFKPTAIDDVVLDSKIKDITYSNKYAYQIHTQVHSLVEGTYPLWPKAYFKLERITFDQNTKSSIMVHPEHDSYHELYVIRGSIIMTYNDGTKADMPQGSAAFIPAAYKKSYILGSSNYAEVLKVSPGGADN